MTTTFSPEDANLFLSGLRLLLDAWRTFRSRKGHKTLEHREEVLRDAVEKAEAKHENATDTVREIEAVLEIELGTEVKNEIFARATSILAIAEPFRVEAFRYSDALFQVLRAAQAFCKSSNIFALRGKDIHDVDHLRLDKLAQEVRALLEPAGFPDDDLSVEHVGKASLQDLIATLMSGNDPLSIHVSVGLTMSYATTGGVYHETKHCTYALVPGREINYIGFQARNSAPYFQSFEQRITAGNLSSLVDAILTDLAGYENELSAEQKKFTQNVGPAITTIVASLRGELKSNS